MTLGAARVAPEKTAFRPVLPMSFVPGITEIQMATMTYKEQLQHPNWQRKRLETLESAGFSCESCGDKETMLHVHHKRYVKGRKAWEYDLDELQVLCAPCHESEHANRELLEKLLSGSASADQLTTAIGLLGGYLDANVSLDADESAAVMAVDGHHYLLGVLASIASGSTWENLAKAARILAGSSLSPVEDAVLRRLEGE